MKAWKCLLPILLVVVVLCSIGWYLFIYDTGFTRDLFLSSARQAESHGNHSLATWLYDMAYRQSGSKSQVAIELAQTHKENGNYTKAEYTLSHAIAEEATLDLYIALSQTYVEQNKLLDAVTMLDNVNSDLKEQLEAMRPASPVATPKTGFYTQYPTVTVKASGGTLYVSTDGEYPSIPDDLYTGGILLPGGETTVYALCVGDNGLVSPLAVFGYTVHGVIEEVTISDPALEETVRQILHLTPDEPLMTDVLWTVTSLTVPSETTDYSALSYFPYLKSLTIESGNFTNFQVLSGFTALEELTIADCDISNADLTIIAGLPNLRNLTIRNCMLSNITPLSECKNLEILRLSQNAIRDLTPLANLTSLHTLDLERNAVEDLTALNSLEKLEVLNVSFNALTSLETLTGCTSLTTLIANHNQIADLPVLSNPQALTHLSLSDNALTSADGLERYTALTNLDLSQNQLTDISKASSLTQLTNFVFSGNKVSTIPTMPSSLVFIDGSDNQISSISPLSGLPKLNIVIMNNNKISNIDSLAKCPLIYRVDVMKNPVKNISKLTELEIIVNCTPV